MIMRKIIIFGLFIIAMSLCGCRDECTDCEENIRMLAIYVKAQGTAKDSITNIEGNIYNVISGTRSTFRTEKKDSVYTQNLEVFESIRQARLELDIFFKGDMKHVMMDLTGDIDFSESRIQVISVEVSFGLLGLEVKFNEYAEDQNVESDLEMKL